jgi:Uma2 family endonuclease
MHWRVNDLPTSTMRCRLAHKHVPPDVFLVRGIPREKERDYYLTWEEGKGPDLVIELTSRSTKEEDLVEKYGLYQDVLKVPEYFLFDPYAEYLKPPLHGFRLYRGRYVPYAFTGRG